ncbi:hypothetical protein [Halonotius roseus]|nr:hypothetical protein [Halonotius roseus]
MAPTPTRHVALVERDAVDLHTTRDDLDAVNEVAENWSTVRSTAGP